MLRVKVLAFESSEFSGRSPRSATGWIDLKLDYSPVQPLACLLLAWSSRVHNDPLKIPGVPNARESLESPCPEDPLKIPGVPDIFRETPQYFQRFPGGGDVRSINSPLEGEGKLVGLPALTVQGFSGWFLVGNEGMRYPT